MRQLRWKRAYRNATLCLAALVLLAVVFLSIKETRWRGNLLLITLDTVRADRLGCYGHDGIATPHIDHLAENGVLFENAIAAAPITLPSHVTLLTGLYPVVHGVRDNSTFRLSQEATTLAEILGREGYRTGAVVGSFVLDASSGLDQGFEHYDDEFGETSGTTEREVRLTPDARVQVARVSERPASEVTRRALAWLEKKTDRPFFLWLHYFDPHFPYSPPPPYSQAYRERPYDGEIAFVDENIGKVIDELEARGILDETLVVIAGDHGEGLGDHGEETHSIFVYEATVRVPLVFMYPRKLPRGSRSTAVASLSDVAPSVLALLDIECGQSFDGVSLFGRKEESPALERFVYAETLFPALNYGWGELRSVRGPQWKYIDAPTPELYNLRTDPQETRNLIEEETETAEKLREVLAALTSRESGGESALMEAAEGSPETIERLRSLGYVSGAPPPGHGAPRRDPKEMIGVGNMIALGCDEMSRGNLREAHALFESVLSLDSANVTVHNLTGIVFYGLGDATGARGEFQRAIALRPDFAEAHYNLGNVLSDQGDLEAAASCYERAKTLNPRAVYYHVVHARALLRMNEIGKAREACERARELGHSSPELLLTDGIVKKKLGLFKAAKERFQELLTLDPRMVDAHLEYGNLLVSMGNSAGALVEYERALSLDPGHAHAHFLVGDLCAGRGNLEKARAHFEKVLELETENKPLREAARERLAALP